MNALRNLLRGIREAKVWSPAGFATRAGLFWILYLIFDLAGARAYTTFLSGTVPQGPFGQRVSSYLGITYLLLYLLAIVVAPILALAAAIFWGVERRIARARQSHEPGTAP